MPYKSTQNIYTEDEFVSRHYDLKLTHFKTIFDDYKRNMF